MRRVSLLLVVLFAAFAVEANAQSRTKSGGGKKSPTTRQDTTRRPRIGTGRADTSFVPGIRNNAPGTRSLPPYGSGGGVGSGTVSPGSGTGTIDNGTRGTADTVGSGNMNQKGPGLRRDSLSTDSSMRNQPGKSGTMGNGKMKKRPGQGSGMGSARTDSGSVSPAP